MKIITANLPKTDVREIKQYVGTDRKYPSRSELLRVAVREWLLLRVAEFDQKKE